MAELTIVIDELMQSSGVGFGTSGARGKVEDMTDKVCYVYTLAFIQHLTQIKELSVGSNIAIAGDYRPSTKRIMNAVAAAISDAGFKVINCGTIASPTVAAFGIANHIPSIMVTGSHIPDDRNGIKFNKADGEILKEDETGIRNQQVTLTDKLFDNAGHFITAHEAPQTDPRAYESYLRRYLDFFPTNCLNGMNIGLYEHSTVLREAMYDILIGLGAKVTKLGFSNIFIPVDTEAVREEDIRLARQWSKEHQLDALVSADGDGDRPLISDEHGEWMRGDIVGILAADYLHADIIATPVSCNSAVEKSQHFTQVLRTRIGSPYVIAAMQSAMAKSSDQTIVGYEANGGFLTQTVINTDGRQLSPLPTRDAILPIIAILAASRAQECAISSLQAELPARYTYSDRLKEFPTEISQAKLAPFTIRDQQQALEQVNIFLGDGFTPAVGIDNTDGVRIILENDEVIHIRPSGNAPELRCYTESDSMASAQNLNKVAMERIKSWRE
ncbi:MAG: phosphomannomutase [Gammaproteobacteria bacterium]|nr:phosphomannomutase [Gammaproteobacteria bacterium]